MTAPDPRAADLLAHLASHQAADAEEAWYCDRLRELLQDPAAFSRRHFTPGHVTGSAFVLHPQRPDVAMIHHDVIGRWLQPGGHVEPGDALVVDASRREVEEETGLSGLVDLGLLTVDIHPYPARRDEPPHEHFDVRWAFRATGDVLAIGDGVSAVRWIPLVDLVESEPSIGRSARTLAARVREADRSGR